MSSSLLKKSLEFIESETLLKGRKDLKNVSSCKPGHVKIKHGSKKGKNRLATLKSSAGSVTVDDARKKIKSGENSAEEQLRRLLLLNSADNIVDEHSAHKIFSHAVKVRREEKVEEPADKATAFTEEDFEKFEKEYFVS